MGSSREAFNAGYPPAPIPIEPVDTSVGQPGESEIRIDVTISAAFSSSAACRGRRRAPFPGWPSCWLWQPPRVHCGLLDPAQPFHLVDGGFRPEVVFGRAMGIDPETVWTLI